MRANRAGPEVDRLQNQGTWREAAARSGAAFTKKPAPGPLRTSGGARGWPKAWLRGGGQTKEQSLMLAEDQVSARLNQTG